jgi:hypothetical protein
LLFQEYINDLPTVTAKNAKLVLYADVTSFVVTNPSPTEFARKLNKIFDDVNEWFRNNLLFLNLNKAKYTQFQTKNSQELELNITSMNNQITNSRNTKFLGSNIVETLSWKSHINQILLRLSLACCAIKVITPLMSAGTLKMICYSCVHSIITYSVIFWENSPLNTVIFKIQKRIIQIMTKSKSGDSCRRLFKRLDILPL